MRIYIHTNLAVFAALLCTACSSPKVTGQQPDQYRITMAESATGTQITCNDTVMGLNEIGLFLSTAPTGNKQTQILLLIDPKVPTAMYFDAMDMLRKVGMDESVSILKWGNPELFAPNSNMVRQAPPMQAIFMSKLNSIEQSVPGYPPQGVGSPEP